MVYIKSFKLHIKHAGGCDYTASCGETVVNLKANCEEHAIEEALDVIDSEFSQYVSALEFATILEVEGTHSINIQELTDTLRLRREQKEEEDQRNYDILDYERLKKKLGK